MPIGAISVIHADVSRISRMTAMSHLSSENLTFHEVEEK